MSGNGPRVSGVLMMTASMMMIRIRDYDGSTQRDDAMFSCRARPFPGESGGAADAFGSGDVAGVAWSTAQCRHVRVAYESPRPCS